MKNCEKCRNSFEIAEYTCPICGAELIDISDDEGNEYEAAEIVSTMRPQVFCKFQLSE